MRLCLHLTLGLLQRLEERLELVGDLSIEPLDFCLQPFQDIDSRTDRGLVRASPSWLRLRRGRAGQLPIRLIFA